ncbi:MAG: glycosyltransferase family 2 protein [Candidatus Latescibacteria bacterium]|nr:glycosyltransferase family 2 protein [Candidatus Latescibacterota bacterium]
MTMGKKETIPVQGKKLPTVSFIISAHNEETVIEKKILNTFGLDYPKDLIEIVVASDGSQDHTPEIVRNFNGCGVKLVEFREHVGKTIAQNEAVRQSTGEILVFSDANSMFDKQAVKELVMKFQDQQVGCVCGELRYRNSETSSIGKSESTYWKYEQFCKKHESLLGSLLGVNGAIYSVRRTCFIELDKNIISDFVLPMEIYGLHYKVLYCSTAIAYENPSNSYRNEFRRKKRIIVRSLYGLLKKGRFLNPLTFGFFAIEIWSHKLLRWFVPVFLLGMFFTSLLLIHNDLFIYVFALQVLFYVFAMIGMVGGETARSFSFFYIPYYFSVINLAAFMAIVELIIGKRYRTWSTDRN